MDRFEARLDIIRKFLANCDFLELLQVSKDVADALEYRAKIEEAILKAQKIANSYT